MPKLQGLCTETQKNERFFRRAHLGRTFYTMGTAWTNAWKLRTTCLYYELIESTKPAWGIWASGRGSVGRAGQGRWETSGRKAMVRWCKSCVYQEVWTLWTGNEGLEFSRVTPQRMKHGGRRQDRRRCSIRKLAVVLNLSKACHCEGGEQPCQGSVNRFQPNPPVSNSCWGVREESQVISCQKVGSWNIN